MVHAPQVPRSQTRLLPVRSARVRSASSSVTRGSIFRSTRLPLTVSVTGTSPGPSIAGPACAAASGTATDVTAVAMLVTPALFKKSLRLTDIEGIIARTTGARAFHASAPFPFAAGGVMQARRDFLRQVLPAGAAT